MSRWSVEMDLNVSLGLPCLGVRGPLFCLLPCGSMSRGIVLCTATLLLLQQVALELQGQLGGQRWEAWQLLATALLWCGSRMYSSRPIPALVLPSLSRDRPLRSYGVALNLCFLLLLTLLCGKSGFCRTGLGCSVTVPHCVH